MKIDKSQILVTLYPPEYFFHLFDSRLQPLLDPLRLVFHEPQVDRPAFVVLAFIYGEEFVFPILHVRSVLEDLAFAVLLLNALEHPLADVADGLPHFDLALDTLSAE